MVTIAFWNVAMRPVVLTHLPCLAAAYGVDVFLLAECPADLTPTLAALDGLGQGRFREATNAWADVKVRAVCRLGAASFSHRFTSIAGELAVWSVAAPKLSPPEVLLAGVHLPSKAGGTTDTDQFSVAKEVSEELIEEEDRRGHRQTALVGDFNMHPYDAAMTSATVFAGLMTRRLAGRPDRTHRKRERPRFYNPMWGLFGDRTPGPAGSNYWGASVLHNTYWALFDQVLVRAPLIDRLAELRLLDADGTHDLVTRDGVPDKDFLSDHLPVLFRLDV